MSDRSGFDVLGGAVQSAFGLVIVFYIIRWMFSNILNFFMFLPVMLLIGWVGLMFFPDENGPVRPHDISVSGVATLDYAMYSITNNGDEMADLVYHTCNGVKLSSGRIPPKTTVNLTSFAPGIIKGPMNCVVNDVVS